MVFSKKAGSFTVVILIFSIFISILTFSPVTATQDFWMRKSGVPYGEFSEYYKAGVVNGKIFVISKSYTQEFNPITDSWTTKTPMPTSRTFFGLAVHQNEIYIIDDSGVLEVYNPETDNWETKEPMPPINWQINYVNVVQDKMHVMEGNVHYIYDFLLDSWSVNELSMPISPSDNVLKTDLDNKIYFFTKNTTQIYDTQTDTWSLGTPMRDYGYLPNNPVATTGVFAPKRIYFFGGMETLFEPSDKTLIYNPQSDTWTSGTRLPTPRYIPACAVMNDTMYVMGGMLSAHSKTRANEQYTPIGYIPEFSSWIILPFLALAKIALLSSKNRLEKMNHDHA